MEKRQIKIKVAEKLKEVAGVFGSL